MLVILTLGDLVFVFVARCGIAVGLWQSLDGNRRRGGHMGGASLWRRVAWSWIARWPTNFLGSASSSFSL